MHRTAWAVTQRGSGSWFIAVREAGGTCRYGFAVDVSRSRAVPAHLLLRVERLNPAVDPEACAVALRALADASGRTWPRVLRVYVELFSPDATGRALAAEHLGALGFRRVDHLRMYRHTPIVDLSGDEEAVFARFHRSARRNIRVVEKSAVELRAITDPALGRRVDALARESFARTGGIYRAVDWEAIIDLARREPDQCRVAGLRRTDADGPDSLVAFEWGAMHGDHAQSVAAGSTRTMGRVPLAYALVWDLMRWARACGARYLDLGGVTAGTHGSGDPLGGISDFKRSFSPTVVEVGDEWILEPHPLAARVAAAVSRAASAVRRIRERRASSSSPATSALLRPAKSTSFDDREG